MLLFETSSVLQSALLGRPGVEEGILQEVYALQLPEEAGPFDQAHLVLMAILMQVSPYGKYRRGDQGTSVECPEACLHHQCPFTRKHHC